MRKTILILSVCLAFGCLPILAAGAANSQVSLNGSWQCVSHGGDQGNMPFTLTFEQSGQDISGHVSSQLGDADFADGTFKNNHLHFVIQGDSDSYTLDADYKDGNLTGTWSTSVSKNKGSWEGHKAPTSGQ